MSKEEECVQAHPEGEVQIAGNQPAETVTSLDTFAVASISKPLVSHEVIVNLIAATTTRAGLRVPSQLDTGKYPKGIKVGKQEFAAIQLRPDTFHGEWNYAITPRS